MIGCSGDIGGSRTGFRQCLFRCELPKTCVSRSHAAHEDVV